MKLFVKRIGHALFPDGDEAIAELEKLPIEKPLLADVRQARNIRFHRLYWALCQRIGTGIGKSAAWVSDAFKVEAGRFQIYRYGGKEHLVLNSIAFSAMEEPEFKEFFEECVQTAYRTWHIDPASVADLLTPEEAHVERR